MGAWQRVKDFLGRIWRRHKAALRDITFDVIDEAYDVEIEPEAKAFARRQLARVGITDPAILEQVDAAIGKALDMAQARVKAELDEHVFGGAPA